MSYAETFGPGPGSTPTPPPWVMHRMQRMERRRGRMMATMTEENPTASTEEGERPDGRRHRGHRGGPMGHPGGWGGRGPWGPPRGRRRDRGDVRAAILLLLAERPRHGYEIITEVTDRSEGRWTPSPGSVYPVLKRLSREDLVTATPQDGKAVFELTATGRALVEAEGAAWGQPWLRTDDETSSAGDQMWNEFRQLVMATKQIDQVNDPAQVEATAAILTEARKRIYGLLAQ